MNLRKIKLALTVDLLNMQNNTNLLTTVKEKMNDFRKEVGSFMESTTTNTLQFTKEHIKQTYSIKYENCTLAIDLVTDQSNCSQYINTFEIQA